MQMSCTVGFVTELRGSSVDWAAIESWLGAHGVADGRVTDIEPVGGDTQNLMFKFRCGNTHLVLRRGLSETQPQTFVPGIMHGDYHLANLMFRNDGPQVGLLENATVFIEEGG
jgi:hypothetical protein